MRGLEQTIARTAIRDGIEGLRSLPSTISESAASERAQDEGQDVLDEASNERMAAASFRRVQSSPDKERRLEQSLAKYVQALTGSGQPTVWFNVEGNKSILTFYPENISGLELGLPKDSGGHFPNRTGTFIRSLAQDRPDLEFFSVGHEFCDAIFDSLLRSTKGRTYALECAAPSAPAWRGFELGYHATGKRDLLARHPGLVNRLERVFSVRTERCFIGEDGKLAADELGLQSLRRGMRRFNRNQAWWNLCDEGALSLTRFYDDWLGLVEGTEQAARALIRKRFTEILEPELRAEQSLIAEQLRQAESTRHDDWKADIEALTLLREAIDNWELELDCIGFLSVNGGLRG